MRIIECIQGDEIWAEERRGRATASRFSEILSPKKCEFAKAGAYTYACELLAERNVPAHYWVSDDYQSRAMANGSATEHEARNYIAFLLGAKIEQVGLIVSDDEFFACSPDGLLGDDCGLELKCPTHSHQIKYLLDPERLITEYRAQCHGGMLVAKRKRWLLVSYAVGLPPVIHEFKVDVYTRLLSKALAKFKSLHDQLSAKLAAMGDPVAATRPEYVPYF